MKNHIVKFLFLIKGILPFGPRKQESFSPFIRVIKCKFRPEKIVGFGIGYTTTQGTATGFLSITDRASHCPTTRSEYDNPVVPMIDRVMLPDYVLDVPGCITHVLCHF